MPWRLLKVDLKGLIEMVRVGKIVWVLFKVKNELKRCKKGYCGNEGFWFAWHHIKVS